MPTLPEEVHTSFYRIAQEVLNNVVKHAQARQVTVSLIATPLRQDSGATPEHEMPGQAIPEKELPGQGLPRHEIELFIKDDGVGFSTEDGHSAHLGIGIMRERAAAIQANLTIESRPGYGTKVTLLWCNPPENIR